MMRRRTTSVKAPSASDLDSYSATHPKPDPENPSTTPADENVLFALWSVGRAATGLLDAALAPAGLNADEFAVYSLLATEGAVASVGLIGNRIDIPLFPLVAHEFTYFGSFWGNYNDLTEVLALAAEGLIKHTVSPVRFEDINDTLDAFGRAVIVFD